MGGVTNHWSHVAVNLRYLYLVIAGQVIIRASELLITAAGQSQPSEYLCMWRKREQALHLTNTLSCCTFDAHMQDLGENIIEKYIFLTRLYLLSFSDRNNIYLCSPCSSQKIGTCRQYCHSSPGGGTPTLLFSKEKTKKLRPGEAKVLFPILWFVRSVNKHLNFFLKITLKRSD